MGEDRRLTKNEKRRQKKKHGDDKDVKNGVHKHEENGTSESKDDEVLDVQVEYVSADIERNFSDRTSTRLNSSHRR